MTTKSRIALPAAAALVLGLMACRAPIERSLLFFPSHQPADGRLAPWIEKGILIGYSRAVDSPANVWLVLHGNGGQASDRAYQLSHFGSRDSVYFVEYPGYGSRPGVPSAGSINTAAKEGYLILRRDYPRTPVCVVGESLGSGPASVLAGLDRPPDKLVLIVPFDRLSSVASEHYPDLIVELLLIDDWDNVKALSHFRGPLDIFGARDDTVIPVTHARELAASVPGSNFVLIDGGHGWSSQPLVKIRNP